MRARQLGISADLYPFEGKLLDIGGHAMHVLDEGPKDGPVVLMVHGNPTWSFYYRNLVRELSSDHRCIVPDHIGCGLSDKPAADAYPYTLERRVSDLDAMLTALDVQGPIHLIVHDWGGGIGMTWAAQHPERMARFVILNTAAFLLPEKKAFPWPLKLTRTPVGAFLVTRFNAFSGVASRVAFKKPVSPAVRHGYTAPYDTPENRVATLRFVQDIPLSEADAGHAIMSQTSDGLAQFGDHPALICWGMKDFVFDKHFLEVWEQRWPHAEVHRFDDCGHYILEDAADFIVPRVRDFLTGAGASADKDRSIGAAAAPSEPARG
ncbi:MAG: alpha/beta fold hydrolase [Myxococcales bacterium]|nr:alpha/beta fold hydrolase [Myxococcales bacterium]